MSYNPLLSERTGGNKSMFAFFSAMVFANLNVICRFCILMWRHGYEYMCCVLNVLPTAMVTLGWRYVLGNKSLLYTVKPV